MLCSRFLDVGILFRIAFGNVIQTKVLTSLSRFLSLFADYDVNGAVAVNGAATSWISRQITSLRENLQQKDPNPRES